MINYGELWDYEKNSVPTCVAACKADKSSMAAVSGGTKCLCGDFTPTVEAEHPANCSAECPGDPAYNCGGPDYVVVWKTGYGSGEQ